jgi:hypothetical protein
MITYIGLGIVILAALYLGWDWLAKNVRDAVDFHSQDSGIVVPDAKPEPYVIEPTRIDALRRLEWLRDYYRQNAMEKSLREVNEAAAAMFADEPKKEEPPSE